MDPHITPSIVWLGVGDWAQNAINLDSLESITLLGVIVVVSTKQLKYLSQKRWHTDIRYCGHVLPRNLEPTYSYPLLRIIAFPSKGQRTPNTTCTNAFRGRAQVGYSFVLLSQLSGPDSGFQGCQTYWKVRLFSCPARAIPTNFLDGFTKLNSPQPNSTHTKHRTLIVVLS